MKEADQKTIEPLRKWPITLCIQLAIAFKTMTRLLIDGNHLLNLDHHIGREYRLFLRSEVDSRLSTNTVNFGSNIDIHLSLKKVTNNGKLFKSNHINYIKSVAPLALDKVALNGSNTHRNQAAMSEWPDTPTAKASDNSNTHYTTSMTSNIASTRITSDKEVLG